MWEWSKQIGEVVFALTYLEHMLKVWKMKRKQTRQREIGTLGDSWLVIYVVNANWSVPDMDSDLRVV